MNSETITREEISRSIAEKIGIPRTHGKRVLYQLLGIMIKSLVEDDQLKLTSFGTFIVLHKDKRVGWNPKTGQEVIITPHKSISLRASDKRRHKISKI